MSKKLEITEVSLPSFTKLKDLYEKLVSLKKDQFNDNERIIFFYNGDDVEIKNFVSKLLDELDIPNFFVIFKKRSNLPKTKLDFIPSDSHCIYPWANLTVHNDGHIKPCCLYVEETGAFIQNIKLNDFYKSDYMKDLREKFKNNQKPLGCSLCWKKEDAGAVSMRNAAKFKFKDLYYRINYEQNDEENLKILDLKIGNNCNLSCRICSPSSSSSIADLNLKNGSLPKDRFIKIMEDCKWSFHDKIYNDLLEVSTNLKYLDLYGGEPLMIKHHFNYLKELIEMGVAKEIKLDYNSNGTFYSDSWFDIWKEFKSVKISFSIDNIGERFELERNGSSWSKVQTNIEKFSKQKSEKFLIDIFPTISIMNVFYLPELISWIAEQDCSESASLTNFVENPSWLSINMLTHTAKEMTLKKLENYKTQYISIDHILHIVKNVKSVDYNKEFVYFMKKFDNDRNQNFLSTHKEIALAMGYN